MATALTVSRLPLAVADKYRRDEVGCLWRDDVPAGTVHYQYKDAEALPQGMWYMCPCGCGNLGWLWFAHATTSKPSWELSGSVERPTLKPSIQKKTPCGWHGHLTDGVFKSCGETT